MQKIKTARLPIKDISRHLFIEHLQFFEGPLVSLYRTERENWLYIWCDSESNQTKNRWLLIKVTRTDLIDYLKAIKSLRNLIDDSSQRFLLDHKVFCDIENFEYKIKDTNKNLYIVNNTNEISEYLPGINSFFKQSLAENIDPDINLAPESYSVPIAGEWFCNDFEKFSRPYSQLYAFFYCTTQQCISNLAEKVGGLLRAPWEGGFSRVHLFESLKRLIPAVHDLEVKKIVYNSPGEIIFEAIPTVNEKIKSAILLSINNNTRLSEIEKFLNASLSEHSLKRKNLSQQSDSTLNLPDHFKESLKNKIDEVSQLLDIVDEVATITSNSPNIVISAKAILSLMVRIKNISSLEKLGQLDLEEKHVRTYRNN